MASSRRRFFILVLAVLTLHYGCKTSYGYNYHKKKAISRASTEVDEHSSLSLSYLDETEANCLRICSGNSAAAFTAEKVPTKAKIKCVEKCVEQLQQKQNRQKRAIIGEECDTYAPDVYITDGYKAPEMPKLCVEFQLDGTGGYKSVNVSWIVPSAPKLKNDSTKYANVTGFFLNWYHASNMECWRLSKSTTHVLLDSSILEPADMKCDILLRFMLEVLPMLKGTYSKGFHDFNCINSSRSAECNSNWNYNTNPVTFRKVTTLQPSTAANSSIQPTTTNTKKQQKGGKRHQENTLCNTRTCQYVVYCSAAGVLVSLLILVLVCCVKKKRVIVLRKSKYVLNNVEQNLKTNKDYNYVSYFDDNSSKCNAVLDFLINSRERAVVVKALGDQADRDNYYRLGPRKFSELYLQNARRVIVLVTKRYLDLCDVNNNMDLDGEMKRVCVEVKYLDSCNNLAANLQLKQLEISEIADKNGNLQTSLNLDHHDNVMTSFANPCWKDKRFIAVMVDSGLKLPKWMNNWPLFYWPQDKSELLHCIEAN